MILQIWIGLLLVITLIWLTRHLELARAKGKLTTLVPADGQTPPAQPPKVSVLVAAKDEEANIGSCATTFLDQNYPDYELIIIDDRSSDRTSEILRSIQATDPNGAKLHPLSVKELPPGWAGKNNAMRLGIESAQGEWYLLSDADCRQTCQTTISAVMNYALKHRVDLLSVLPVLDTQTVWEKIIQPVAGAVLIFWFNPVRVNNPASKVAYANGAFILIRKDVYEKLGGHAAVRHQLNEDLHMAKLAKQKGFSLRVVQNDGLYLTRMYRNFHETWRGWSRIFYGCFGTVRQLLISAAFMTIISLLPWVSLAISGIAVAWAAAGHWTNLWYVSVATVLAQLSVLVRFYLISKSDVRYVITWPIGAALCIGMLFSAILKTLGWTGTAWRGTVYRQGQQVPTAQVNPKAVTPAKQEVRS